MQTYACVVLGGVHRGRTDTLVAVAAVCAPLLAYSPRYTNATTQAIPVLSLCSVCVVQLGHRLIKQQFGVVPRATWQVRVRSHLSSRRTRIKLPRRGLSRAPLLRAPLGASVTLLLLLPLSTRAHVQIDPFGHSATQASLLSSPLVRMPARV